MEPLSRSALLAAGVLFGSLLSPQFLLAAVFFPGHALKTPAMLAAIEVVLRRLLVLLGLQRIAGLAVPETFCNLIFQCLGVLLG